MTEIIIKPTKKEIEDISVEDLRSLSNDNFLMWCMTSGAKVDNNEIEFDTHRYLIPIYMDNTDHIVWQKAAQLGATVYMLLRTLWWLEKHQGRKAGLYFPTNDGVQNLSKDRLTPLIDSCPSIKAISPDSGKLNLRHIGSSSFYLYHLGGVASKDSVPMDFVSFDEVRLCDAKDIDQTLHRIAHSPYKLKTFMSTCKTGDTKIWVRKKPTTKLYKVSTQPVLMSLEELKTCWQDYQALSYASGRARNAKKYVFRDITAFHDNGVKDIVKVTFDDGRSVRTTSNHEYAVTSTKPRAHRWVEWKPVSELVNSTEFRNLVLTGVESTRELHAPYDLLSYYVFGAYLAEGSVVTNTTNTIEIAQLSTTNNRLRTNVIQWATSLGLECKEHPKRLRVSLCKRPDLFELFSSFGSHANTKNLPSKLLEASKEQLEQLLQGFIDGDGWYTKNGWGMTTTSPQIRDSISAIAFRLGMPTFYRYYPPKGNSSEYWQVVHEPNSRRLNMQSEKSGVRLGTVVAIEEAGAAQVYDITIDLTHNYVLENGYVVHNCGLPDNDINRRWQQGTQHIWRSACGCPDGCDLARAFPDCVVTDDPKRPGQVYLRCPKCRYEIKDAQNGRYVANNPSADFHSYHVSQLVSKYRSTKDVWTEFLNTTNIEEFYNAALGIPYIDSANRGVTPGQLESCVNSELSWMKDEKRQPETRTAMGVDQGGAYNMVVIADIDANGRRKRIRHVEIIEQLNPTYYEENGPVSPFNRLYKLMDEFNVGICVIDMMPNYNEALKFAQSFPGRVFLAYYKRDGKEVVQWGDRGKFKENVRKAGPLLKFKYQCAIGRFPSLSYALGEWAEGNVQIPPLDGIRQVARSEEHDSRGQLLPESPARRLFSHLPRLIKRWTEVDAETGNGRWEWVYAGGDPHLAHAWNYCNIALERLRRKAIFTFG